MQTKFDIALMVKVAQMYYIDGLKQEEIAKQVQISRSLISMILTEAKEVGIVEVKVRNPLLNNDHVSSRLQEEFNLKSCIAVPTSVQDVTVLRKLIAQRAVDLVNELVENNMTIGLAWGRTCFEFVSLYRAKEMLNKLTILPLIGGSDQTAGYYQLNEMVRVLAKEMGGTPYFIHAPAITVSKEEKKILTNTSSMQAIMQKWNHMDIVITGIGSLPTSKGLDRETYIGEHAIYKQLEADGAVGDICARYFTKAGKVIKGENYDLVIGVPIEVLRDTETVICIAAGKEKVVPILGALKTGVVDILITDEHTGMDILNHHSAKPEE
jgi:deoxyribonucleoside regulator